VAISPVFGLKVFVAVGSEAQHQPLKACIEQEKNKHPEDKQGSCERIGLKLFHCPFQVSKQLQII